MSQFPIVDLISREFTIYKILLGFEELPIELKIEIMQRAILLLVALAERRTLTIKSFEPKIYEGVPKYRGAAP